MRERRTTLSCVRRQSQHVSKVTQALFAHSQHQVVDRHAGRGAIVLTSFHVQATAIKTINLANNRAGDSPGRAAMRQGGEHG